MIVETLKKLTYTIIQDSLGVNSMQGTVLLLLYYLFPQTFTALKRSHLCGSHFMVQGCLDFAMGMAPLKDFAHTLFSVLFDREDWGGRLALLPTCPVIGFMCFDII